MKTKPPYNIWVYHKANGKTSFGEYIHGKKLVFLTGKLNRDTADKLSVKIAFFKNATGREVEFKGDMLPMAFMGFLWA